MKDDVPRLCGLPLKWVSLLLLTFQTSWQAFSLKIARVGSTEYLNSTVVFFAELLKLVISLILLAREDGRGLRLALREVMSASRADVGYTLKLCVPALAYAAQNNLIFISLDKLSAAVQQVTYQMKILTAALLSVTMLGKTVTVEQWLSLSFLVVGVVLVQLQQLKTPTGTSKIVTQGLGREASTASVMNATVGFVAVVFACILSGFAGVFMEKVLKSTSKSIWLRNAQLAFFGSLMALLGIVTQDLAKVLQGGLTQGYNFGVWVAVFTTAYGGLLVAVVLKYADNILRQFSTALSISITTIISAAIMQDVSLDASFLSGTTLAIGATFVYNGMFPKAKFPHASKWSLVIAVALAACGFAAENR